MQRQREGLPSHAQRVFKGKIFEIWQWQQKMFDGSIETFEKAWRFPTVEVIATIGDKILIEEQDQPDRANNITLVSGRADQGENMLAEAKRELLEETGCESKDWELFLKHGGSGKVLHNVYYFLARNCTKKQEPVLDAGERIGVKFITLDQLIELSEEPRFWVSPQFIHFLAQLKSDPNKKEVFKNKLFPH